MVGLVWDPHELNGVCKRTAHFLMYRILPFFYFNCFHPSLKVTIKKNKEFSSKFTDMHIYIYIYIPFQEEFLRDVMEFLILRGHNRLIPQGGLAEFPDAILNAKRLDLYNLYREVTCFIGAGFICLVRDDCYVNYVACLFYDFYVQASFSL